MFRKPQGTSGVPPRTSNPFSLVRDALGSLLDTGPSELTTLATSQLTEMAAALGLAAPADGAALLHDFFEGSRSGAPPRAPAWLNHLSVEVAPEPPPSRGLHVSMSVQMGDALPKRVTFAARWDDLPAGLRAASLREPDRTSWTLWHRAAGPGATAPAGGTSTGGGVR